MLEYRKRRRSEEGLYVTGTVEVRLGLRFESEERKVKYVLYHTRAQNPFDSQ